MIGIDSSQFIETLTPVPHRLRKEPAVTMGKKYKLLEHKLRHSLLSDVAIAGGDCGKSESKLKFSFDELCKVWFSCSIQLGVHNLFHPTYKDERNDKFAIIGKLANSMWRYGMGADWNTLVTAYNNLSRFQFGDFEFRLDVTHSFNKTADAVYHSDIYLDGPLAYIIYYKGKPALTISFAIVAGRRLLINQVQLTNKRGNRWLYKLPCHYFDFAIECMEKAFSDFDVFLVDGHSTADRIKSSYDGDKGFTKEKYQHIVKTYRQKLLGFIRRGRIKISGMTFHHLFHRQILTN